MFRDPYGIRNNFTGDGTRMVQTELGRAKLNRPISGFPA